MHGLNGLVARHSQLQVLRVLYHAQQPLTGREIERRTGLSNRATMIALATLTERSAVLLEETGNAHFYQLNLNHYFVAKGLKPAFEAEDLFWTDFRKTVHRGVRPLPLAAIATGPLARDDSSLNTRIQLTMLFSNSRNRIRAFNRIETLHQTVWTRYAITIDPVFLDINTMDQDKYDVLWRRVEREGILLFGTLP